MLRKWNSWKKVVVWRANHQSGKIDGCVMTGRRKDSMGVFLLAVVCCVLAGSAGGRLKLNSSLTLCFRFENHHQTIRVETFLSYDIQSRNVPALGLANGKRT